jgi:hypothetical protein
LLTYSATEAEAGKVEPVVIVEKQVFREIVDKGSNVGTMLRQGAVREVAVECGVRGLSWSLSSCFHYHDVSVHGQVVKMMGPGVDRLSRAADEDQRGLRGTRALGRRDESASRRNEFWFARPGKHS